jgi:hypothetical protein
MESKQKSAVLTFILSMFPGVGHYYLGLMNRGLQFMLFFLGGIVTVNLLRIHELGAFIPAIWFYALFDALQMAGAINSGENVEDKPVIAWNSAAISQKMVGWGLVLIGLYSLLKILVPRFIPGEFFEGYLQTAVIAIVLIVVGVRILQPKKTDGINNANAPKSNAVNMDTTVSFPNTIATENPVMADSSNRTGILNNEGGADSHDE